jgi:hypothetical protein
MPTINSFDFREPAVNDKVARSESWAIQSFLGAIDTC